MSAAAPPQGAADPASTFVTMAAQGLRPADSDEMQSNEEGPAYACGVRVADSNHREPHGIESVVEVVAAQRRGEDRACVVDLDDGVAIVVADGVGGTGNGGVAARRIVDAVGALTRAPDDWCGFLEELDGEVSRLGSGRSTAVIVAVRDGTLSGTSAGDSGAWLINQGEMIDLTEGQQRRPFVGGGCIGCAIPPVELTDGTLLVASDGLLNYAKPGDILEVASGRDLRAAARALVELVRLRNGKLQDDVAVVLCRRAADR